MEPMTLVVAGVAAAAIFLIAIGIATSGSGSAVSNRLERYASGKDTSAAAGGQGGLAEMISSSVALLPVWKYGPVSSTLRKLGVLKNPRIHCAMSGRLRAVAER